MRSAYTSSPSSSFQFYRRLTFRKGTWLKGSSDVFQFYRRLTIPIPNDDALQRRFSFNSIGD